MSFPPSFVVSSPHPAPGPLYSNLKSTTSFTQAQPPSIVGPKLLLAHPFGLLDNEYLRRSAWGLTPTLWQLRAQHRASWEISKHSYFVTSSSPTSVKTSCALGGTSPRTRVRYTILIFVQTFFLTISGNLPFQPEQRRISDEYIFFASLQHRKQQTTHNNTRKIPSKSGKVEESRKKYKNVITMYFIQFAKELRCLENSSMRNRWKLK